MDTKWKSMFETLDESVGQKKRWNLNRYFDYSGRVTLAVILAVLAVMLLYHLFANSYYGTMAVWFLGIPVNLLLGAAVFLVVPETLKRRYSGWDLSEESFFEEWSRQWDSQQKIMLRTFLILMILGGLICFMAFNGSFLFTYYYPYNYAPYYLLVATMILQTGLCEGMIIRFMMKKLREHMEGIRKIRQEKMDAALAEALEIERRSMEKVSRSDQLRMDLISNVSHDLKTPLTSMVGYLELLKKEELGDTARDYLEVISRRAEKLKEMIESLFSLAKVSSGNVELRRDSITMNRLMEQVFADMEDRIRDSKLEFVVRLTRDDTAMVTDNGYLYRICQNLMENALKYSAAGTRVFVKTFVDEQNQIGLEITNTAGYRMDFDKEDIVERFARGDKARTTEGNGLGLAIVSTYAKALGGSFDIFIDCDQFKARLLFGRGEAVKEETAEEKKNEACPDELAAEA